jgi:predicted amidohydrolase
MSIEAPEAPLNQGIQEIDEFLVVERTFSPDQERPSVGLANMHSVVHDIEGNKDKIVRAAKVFKERKANFAIFPEFCLSGYFWEDEEACRRYMDTAVIENHVDWIEQELKPLLDENLRAIILNGLSRAPGGKYYNKTMIIAPGVDYMSREANYRKVFLPGIEKRYTVSGVDDRLVVGGRFARVGFTTCYDYLFSELLRLYTMRDKVDVVIEIASWRAFATRDYSSMNVRSDSYYGDLWDMVMAAFSATHQIWTVACNAVGEHEVSGVTFWGGSGIWSPSGLKLIQASHYNEELLIVHNLDFKTQRKVELDDFDYAFDFSTVYRAIKGPRRRSRID